MYNIEFNLHNFSRDYGLALYNQIIQTIAALYSATLTTIDTIS